MLKERFENKIERDVDAEVTETDRRTFDNLCTVITAIILAVIIAGTGIINLAAKDRAFSEDENRNLAQKPKFSLSSLASGKFTDDAEKYLSDQFVFRSNFVKTRTAIDIFVGKKEVGGVYIGKKHFLFEKPVSYDDVAVGKTIAAINNFTEKHGDVRSYAAIAPNACEILSDYMPKTAPAENQSEQIKKVYSDLDKDIKTIDLCTPLGKAADRTKLYYKTDHHWTTAAARIAFDEIAKQMKIDASDTKYSTYFVTDDFQGTLSSMAGLFSTSDSIEVTVPQSKVEYAVTYVNENKNSASFFDSSKLSQKNKYELFFGGNFAQINITTTRNTDRVLLVIKDSYANCLLPMLYPYFKSIVVVDPRYYTDDIEQIIGKEEVTDVLWLYNANTFLADTSITGVFE
ncbi:MAG: hypothetical protein E7571_00465 [Ruminococcaceae bacterium]|nr:hypothetical protein [Oscillospiraceae bacterium]